MDARERRIATFESTRRTILENPRLLQAVYTSRKNQGILWEEDPMPRPAVQRLLPAELRLTLKKTVEAAAPYARAGKKVCILNFASSVAPGGGVTQGAQAQEESICRVSTLFFALNHRETAMEFYNRHWEKIRAGTMNRRNSHDLIYTPGVIAIRDAGADERLMKEQDWFSMDVITCAAPDLRQVPYDKSAYTPSPMELWTELENRWRRILAAAAAQGVEVLILGAFGCGVFACPPDVVARTFGTVFMEYRHCFETVEFAVFTRDRTMPNYSAFRVLPGVREC